MTRRTFERSAPLEHADILRCAQLLPSVSRTFALTIRVLPGSLRETVTVAYLLCRMADVLEDANQIDPRARRDGLLELANALAAVSGGCLATNRGEAHHGSPASVRALAEPISSCQEAEEARARERLLHCLDAPASFSGLDPPSHALLGSRDAVLRAFLALPPISRSVLARWVEVMARGMAEFVAKELEVPSADGALLVKLHTREEMRAYAYCVAGTVGHLLTELFTDHLRLGESGKTARLRELAAPFGLGLQLTNILQDLSEDRGRGWSYVPEELARSHGTSLARLQQESDRGAALRVIAEVIEEAARHLDSAMEFALLIPRTAPRIRLFCLWPIFFARRTLVKLWGEPAVLAGAEKVRISRAEVRGVMGQTAFGCLFDRRLIRLYEREQGRLRERMSIRPV